MQKNIYTLLVCMTAALAASAQIGKGTILLGGDINLNNYSQPIQAASQFKVTNSSFFFTPSFGKAIKDNRLVLGIDLNIQRQESKDNDTANFNDSKTETYGGGIFLQEYKSLGRGFYIFTTEAFNGSYIVAHNNGLSTSKGYALSLGLTPGISYAVCPHVMVNPGLQNLFHISYSHNSEGVNIFSAGSSLSTAVRP